MCVCARALACVCICACGCLRACVQLRVVYVRRIPVSTVDIIFSVEMNHFKELNDVYMVLGFFFLLLFYSVTQLMSEKLRKHDRYNWYKHNGITKSC